MNVRDHIMVPETADLRAAMLSLKKSGRGLVVVHDAEDRVVGVLSDGDIRKALLEHEDLNASVTDHMTRDFVWVTEGTPKERTLKLLDARIRSIPVLDTERRLVTLVSTGYMEPRSEAFARAKAPVRVSLAGGGTDFTNYFVAHGGVSLSTTIALHSHVVVRKRSDRRIRIHFEDHHRSLEITDIDALSYDGDLDLIKAGIRVMNPDFGFDLWVSNDYPPGAGLGGSATVLAAVIGALNEFREDHLEKYAIAEHAFEAERIELTIKGGWQDQYSTVFGGFNFIEFDEHRNTVTPLRLDTTIQQELEERFLLCSTGRPHLGGAIQAINHQRAPDDPKLLAFAEEVKAIADTMKAHLLRGNLSDFGRLLHTTWELKKRVTPAVTTPDIDAIYDVALRAGAEGGRLLGTGGGGYFLFFLRPFHRYEVTTALQSLGAKTQSVVFDDCGLQSWKARA